MAIAAKYDTMSVDYLFFPLLGHFFNKYFYLLIHERLREREREREAETQAEGKAGSTPVA